MGDIGQGPAVAGDDGDPAGHGLDDDAAELLAPAGGVQRGHREHVEAAVEVGQGRGVDRSHELDPPSQVLLLRPRAQVPVLRPRPGDPETESRLPGHGLEQDVDALVPCETTDVAHLDRSVGRRGSGRARGEVRGIDAQSDEHGSPGEALAGDDPARGGVADADGAGAAQGPPLEPAEGGRVSLVDVLRGVEAVRGA